MDSDSKNSYLLNLADCPKNRLKHCFSEDKDDGDDDEVTKTSSDLHLQDSTSSMSERLINLVGTRNRCLESSTFTLIKVCVLSSKAS